MTAVQFLERIRRLAEEAPSTPAVVAGEHTLDRAALLTAAEAVRDRLVALGVGADDVVACVLPRSAGAVATMLGTWLAGAAYAPVDPTWPPRRLDLVLAGCAVSVTRPHPGAPGDVEVPGEPGLALTRLRPAGDEGSRCEATARHLAHVIRTSGTTGSPNAVGVDRASLDAYASSLHELLAGTDLGADTPVRILLSAGLTFDASLRPVLLLAAGATLVIAPELADGDWSDHVDVIRAAGVTVLSGVPSWYAGLATAGFDPADSDVRLAIVGGEPVPNGLVRRLRTAGCSVVVQYGPTETTVAVTGGVLRSDDSAEPPLGHPLPGARVLLLDEDLCPVADGEPGMLHVGGPGVGRGYLDDPALTAERFLPDPSGPPGSRMFRTGDRARRLPDGALAYLGRDDDQVKIGGRRIEPAEVAAMADRHPGVDRCVVVTQVLGAHPRLALCYVADRETDPTGLDDALQAYLARELPEHLVPPVIRRLDTLPTSERGKVDREAVRALLAAAPTTPIATGAVASAAVAAGTLGQASVEERFLAIVSDTLGVPCTLDDDFFHLGGGSLDALDILAGIRQEFGVRIRLREFFESPRLRAVMEALT